MPNTILDNNVFSLGLIQPSPGTPLGIFSNFPDMIVAGGALGPSAPINMVLIQYVTSGGSTGIGYFGNQHLVKATLAGCIYRCMANGDSFSLASYGLNVFVASNFLLDVDNNLDGFIVTIHVR